MQTPPQHTSEELHSALFANMVMQQGNLALMFLGKVPNPETGEAIFDLEGARMFIDQLEMLHAKTKGNLNSDETALLGQTLATVRMTYVEEARGAAKSQQHLPRTAIDSSAQQPSQPAVSAPQTNEPAADDKKKFTKKY